MAKSSRKEVVVEPSAHVVAIAQARAFSTQAQALEKTIVPSGNPAVIGQQIAFLVIVGLALELYFKSFMIRARAGRVTLGHDLSMLLREFPAPFQNAFATEYELRLEALPENYTTTALLLSKERPATPEGNGPALRFDTFEACIASLADAFIRFRYLFEGVNYASWTYVPFANQYAIAAIQTLETTYVRFENGDFKGQLNPASASPVLGVPPTEK